LRKISQVDSNISKCYTEIGKVVRQIDN